MLNKESLEMTSVVNFASRYNELKGEKLIPKEILEIMLSEMECSKSTYYVYLQRARDLRIVTDTYEENKAKLHDRQRAQAELKKLNEEKEAAKMAANLEQERIEIEIPEGSRITIDMEPVDELLTPKQEEKVIPKKSLFQRFIGLIFKE